MRKATGPRATGTKPARKPRVVNSGTRRSEKFTDIKDAPTVDTGIKFLGRENEDPRFPGLRTVIVPRDDPRDAMHMSPIGAYEGMGYHKLSEETRYTGHAGHVLMAIDVDEYNRREDKRVTEQNNRVVEGFSYNDIQSQNGPNDPMKFHRDRSSVKVGERGIPVSRQVQDLRNATR